MMICLIMLFNTKHIYLILNLIFHNCPCSLNILCIYIFFDNSWLRLANVKTQQSQSFERKENSGTQPKLT